MPKRELSDKGAGDRAGDRRGGNGEGSWPLFPKESWERVAAALELEPGEVEIARRIFRNESEKTMAERMGESERGVHEAVGELYGKLRGKKLRVRSRIGCIVELTKKHLVHLRLQPGAGPLPLAEEMDGGYPVFGAERWHAVARSLKLSRRQVALACGVFREETELRIGKRLGISEHTVHKQLNELYEELGEHGRVALVLRLLKEHLRRLGGDSGEVGRPAPSAHLSRLGGDSGEVLSFLQTRSEEAGDVTLEEVRRKRGL
ncbi:MAG: hypothetical protein HUU20_22105 [Pirellulales bacterium]|nr:hypothetical protein [Pirellulales bacterium]